MTQIQKTKKHIWLEMVGKRPFISRKFWASGSMYILAVAEGSTHIYLLMAGNLHQIDHFSRKHPWVGASWVLSSVTSSTGHSVCF